LGGGFFIGKAHPIDDRTHSQYGASHAIAAQSLLQFADQPQRVAEVLRTIEGVSEGAEDMSVGGTQRELLSRRIPKTKMNMTI
jgi:hypothetical protein